MANAAGDMDKKPAYNGRGMRLLACCHVDIGATGAPTVDATKCDDPGITITRASAGIYDLVYPKCVDVRINIEAMSPLGTVLGAVLLAKSATAGTAQFRTFNDAGTATDPASGDDLNIVLVMDCEKV